MTYIKWGFTINPPTIFLYYTISNKLRKKTMPLRDFKHNSNSRFFAEDIKKRHEISLPLIKIEKLLRIAQEMMQGKTAAEAGEAVENIFAQISNNANLNKLSNYELDQQKEEMNVLFTMNQVKSQSDNFEYDKQVEFEPKANSEWDEDNDEDFFK